MSVPSNINTDINKISNAKQQIKNAIASKGVEVSDTDTFKTYADKIDAHLQQAPEGELDITSNGTYNVAEYSSAKVNVPVDDVSYDTWNEHVMRVHDITADTTKFYSIATNDEYPYRDWNICYFPNVREIRSWGGTNILSNTSVEYGPIDFSNLENIYSVGSYFCGYKTNKTMTFPKLKSIQAGNYPFYYLVECNVSFPLLEEISPTYSFYNTKNSIINAPKLSKVSSYFLEASSGEYTFPSLTKLGGYIGRQANNSSLTINLTSPDFIYLGSYPFGTSNSGGTWTLNIPNAPKIGWDWGSNVTYPDTKTFACPEEFILKDSSYVVYSPNEASFNFYQDILKHVTEIETSQYIYYSLSNDNITEINMPKLTTINTCNYFMSRCSKVTKVSLPELTTINNGTSLFYSCSNLTTVELPKLIEITGSSRSMFSSCNTLTRLDLPSCTTLVNSLLSGSSLTEIHFASANRAAIEANDGYSNVWGRGSANCTVYFDL